MKLNVILDSHKGEILNLLLAVSFWNRNEKQLKKINIIYIGSFNNWMLIQEYLKIIKSISNVKVSFFEIESLSISKVKRIKNAILLYYNILLLRIKSNLFFVPYDQRSFFYNFLSLLKCKSIALPHTTGLEVYSKGVFNYKLRNDKKIPVLGKIEGCEEYFNSLGSTDFYPKSAPQIRDKKHVPKRAFYTFAKHNPPTNTGDFASFPTQSESEKKSRKHTVRSSKNLRHHVGKKKSETRTRLFFTIA